MWAVVETVRGFRHHFWLYKVTVYGRRYVNGLEEEYKFATYHCESYGVDYKNMALKVIGKRLGKGLCVQARFAGLSHLYYTSQGRTIQVSGRRLIE